MKAETTTPTARVWVLRRAGLAAAALLVAVTVAGCTAGPESEGATVAASTPPAHSTGGSSTSTPIPALTSTGTAATPPPAQGGTAVRVTIGDTRLEATLSDNPAARSLVDQLPLTLSFEDYGQQEKVASLPRPLPMDGMPAGDDPEPLEVGYYAPDGLLVLYYADVGYFNGIARLGHLDIPIEDLVALPDGVTVTIELSQ